ncbi:MAG: signal recognition particle protein [Defluviitaleaceae bacterium]|nr:signal recognition particle protein [Defluviitaleaceae bacterium]
MAFENLSQKLQDVFKQLRGKGVLNEKDVKSAMREVRLALLEADVNFKVVKDFVERVSQKAVGENILSGINAGQQVVKIVHEELIELLGGTGSKLTFSPRPPTVYMMVGLQGAGKTTACGKLAGQMRKQGKKPLLVACDVYRPAAVKQLQILGSNFNIPVFSIEGSTDPVRIAKESLAYAVENSHDLVILDTAGRLHINEELMNELVNVKKVVSPQEILLVVDAMTGQDAVNVAQSFGEQLGIDGIIITKLDGDTRGGAALSVRAVTGKPVKYVGLGEKLEDMGPFHPERMASRILGMGDVLSLIEKAQDAIDEKAALDLEKKMRAGDFTLDDFLSQMQQIKKMGPLKDILGMIPGMTPQALGGAEIDDKAMAHVEAIVLSMTPKERANPAILNGSRKKRVATGSGRSIQEVNRLLKQFEEMKKMMKHFTDMSKGKKGMGGALGKLGNLGLPFR